MACEFKPVGVGANSCSESYAGTGTTAYLFKTEDVDQTELKIDEETNNYSGFALKTGKKIYPIVLKNQANKVDGTLLGPNKGFSNAGTIVVEKDLDLLAVVARTANNSSFGMLLRKPGVGTGCYILWNPNVNVTLEITDTTGDAFDSDNTSTWVVTSAPMPYTRMGITEAEFTALTVAEPEAGGGA